MTTWSSEAATPSVGTHLPVRFIRLPEVDLRDVVALLNEPRNRRHMPLADTFDDEAAKAWVEAKDAQWEQHGYGPWAIMVDGVFAGWGGFQREPNGADFALVLGPRHWGEGAAITQEALRIGFTELGLDVVLIALPASRNPRRVVARFGFLPDGTVEYAGTTFAQYRLTKLSWASGGTSSADAEASPPVTSGGDQSRH